MAKHGLMLLFLLLITAISASRVQSLDLNDVKVVGLYEPTITTTYGGHTAVELLHGMDAGFVMRGFFKWDVTPPSQYDELKASIAELKQAVPELIYEGAVTTAFFVRDDTWADGRPISDSEFSQMVAHDKNGNPLPDPGFPNAGFLGDLASPLYREYLAGWAEKQIDAGVDAMFFDQVYGYAHYRVETMGQDLNLVYLDYAGYYKMLVDELKSYAASRGRQFCAARNSGVLMSVVEGYLQHPFLLQADDYIHGSFSTDDFSPPFVPVEDFGKIKADLTQAMGREVPIIMFIDWAGRKPGTQLSRFVSLSTEDQITVLRNIDAATKQAGILFAYPVYGGQTVKGDYDSVKYGTYETIVSLATGSQLSTTTASATSMIIYTTTSAYTTTYTSVIAASGYTTTTVITTSGYTTATVTASGTTGYGPYIPGFRIESIALGLVVGLAVLFAIRTKRKETA